MKLKYAFCWILIVLPSFIYSQKVECNESDFTDKSVYKKTKSALTVANNEFIKNYPEAYRIALEKYLFAYENCSNNALLNYRIGVCYQCIDSAHKSLNYFLNAFMLDSNISSDIHFKIGMAYQLNYKFRDAIIEFNKYKCSLDNSFISQEIDVDISNRINNCINALSIDTNKVIISNIGKSVNSVFDDYCSVVTNDTLIFTSIRNSKYNRLIENEYKYFERIYFSKISNGMYSESLLYDTNKTSFSEYNIAYLGYDSKNKKHMVFISGNNTIRYNYATFSDRKIYLHDELQLKFMTDYPYRDIFIDYTNSKVYMTVYFSDSSTDIYFSDIGENNKWSDPLDIGKILNTEFSENGVFITPDGRTMYFSSNGHNSIGGYDIFVSTLDSSNNWSKPINLGYPINSVWDDLFYFESKEGSKAYFTSNRPGGHGGYDLYEFEK